MYGESSDGKKGWINGAWNAVCLSGHERVCPHPPLLSNQVTESPAKKEANCCKELSRAPCEEALLDKIKNKSVSKMSRTLQQPRDMRMLAEMEGQEEMCPPRRVSMLELHAELHLVATTHL